jgi:septal ring factor EnvC (AmiA/AmiB activator)
MKRLIVIALSVVCSNAYADKVSDKKADLEKFKKKIQVQKQQLETLKVKEDSIIKKLGQIDQKKAVLKGQKKNLEKNIGSISSEINQTSQSIDQRRDRIEIRKKSITGQLRNLYMYGEMNYMKIFLASTTFDDLNQKQFLVKQWVDHDRKRMSDFQDEVRLFMTEKKELEQKKNAKESDLGKLKSTEEEIAQEKESKKKLLSMVKNQKDYYKRSIEEMEQASKNLETLIKKFKETKPATKGTPSNSRFAQMRGKLLMPTKGKIERMYGPYRDAKLNANLYQKGIDIRAKEGADVQSVFDGKVAYADWFAGYGKVVIIDHDAGYFTLYAHLSEIQVSINQQVVVGDTIGSVGDTESMKGDYLYFELREKGVTVNPLPWLDR